MACSTPIIAATPSSSAATLGASRPAPRSSAPRPAPDGRTFKGMAPGSRKARGGFWLPAPTAELDALLLVESALDALSAVRLLAPSLPPDTLVASTAGLVSALPRWLQAFHAPRTICAYDDDQDDDQDRARKPADRRPVSRRQSCRPSPSGTGARGNLSALLDDGATNTISWARRLSGVC